MGNKITLHGLAMLPAGGVEFRFGFAAFLGYVWTSQLTLPGRAPRAWPFRRIDNGFTHLQNAARHLAFKLEWAAAHYAEKAAAYGAAVVSGNLTPRDEELSVLLDAIAVYLRVLPDLVAAATPYFYARGSPSSRSFREQTTWFTKTRTAFDPQYAEILAAHQEWFELLAGKEEKGLRDLLIHRFGKFQFPVTTEPYEQRGEVSADLVTLAGYRPDSNRVLSRITAGLALFLDAYVVHFNERIRSAAEWAPLSRYDGIGCKVLDFRGLPRSSWLLPIIAPGS